MVRCKQGKRNGRDVGVPARSNTCRPNQERRIISHYMDKPAEQEYSEFLVGFFALDIFSLETICRRCELGLFRVQGLRNKHFVPYSREVTEIFVLVEHFKWDLDRVVEVLESFPYRADGCKIIKDFLQRRDVKWGKILGGISQEFQDWRDRRTSMRKYPMPEEKRLKLLALQAKLGSLLETFGEIE
jgi:hypothetical protein